MTLAVGEVTDTESSLGFDLFYGKTGPTPKQILFRDATEKYKLFGGGVGGGKSVAGCAEGLRFSLLWPGNRGYVGRHEAEALRRTTLMTLLARIGEIEDLTGEKLIAKNGHNQTKKEIHLVNGSVILYGGIGDQEALDRIKSLEIGWFFIDEASETNKPNIDMLKARLRWKLPDGSYPKFFGLFASNPEPGWVKDEFVTPQLRGKPREDHIFVQSLLKDNPYLPPGYIDDLRRDNPPNWVKRYIEGDWGATEGQIWPEFEFNVHVFPNALYPHVEIPKPKLGSVPIVFALDHGQVNPTCLLEGWIDQDENCFISDEYYDSGLVSQHVAEIKKKFAPAIFDDEVESVADPSIFDKTREKHGNMWSIADEYADHSIHFSPANNDRISGFNRVGEFFRIIEGRPTASPLT